MRPPTRTTLLALYDVVVAMLRVVEPGQSLYRALCQVRTELECVLELPRTPTRRRG